MRRAVLIFALGLALAGCSGLAAVPTPSAAVALSPSPVVVASSPTVGVTPTVRPAASVVPVDVRHVCRCWTLNVRLSPAVDGEAVAWLLAGQRVEVYEVYDGWARLEDGWARESYLCR